jgi:ribonuclease VapC
MFIDASAIVAILNDEPEAQSFEAAIESHDRKIFVSPIVRFEAIVSLAAARSRRAKIQTSAEAIALASQAVAAFVQTVQAQDAPILSAAADRAVAAAAKFGRAVSHKAALNLGDCFAYAIAQSYREPILFKGDDFTHTDLQSVVPFDGITLSIRAPRFRARKRGAISLRRMPTS